jgi:hypothetical protein
MFCGNKSFLCRNIAQIPGFFAGDKAYYLQKAAKQQNISFGVVNHTVPIRTEVFYIVLGVPRGESAITAKT